LTQSLSFDLGAVSGERKFGFTLKYKNWVLIKRPLIRW
jgi:hypothetical protein